MVIKGKELKEMVAKIVKETMQVGQNAVDPQSGLNMLQVMEKIKQSRNPTEMAKWVEVFQRLNQAHF